MDTHILVIEDNKEVRENISEILELSDYKVACADNGMTGVEMCLKEKFDVIICDIMMPQLDGYGVLHLLNKRTETKNIPFIFLTAKSEKGDFRKGMGMGADDYLTKPFDGIDLLKAVEIRLQKSEAFNNKNILNAAKTNSFTDSSGNFGIERLTSGERNIYNYKKKHSLYSEGQRAKVLYYIIKGKIKVFKINLDGKELIINIYKEGDFVGYTNILEDIPYMENGEVLEDASVTMIPAGEFLELILNNSKAAQQFIKLIAKNILQTEEDLLNLAYNSLRKKVAYGLIQKIASIKNKDEVSIVLDLSRKEMAQIIGVATESFIRTLSDFKDEKLIDIKDGKIFILNESKLKNLPN